MSLADYNLIFTDPTTGQQIDALDDRRIIRLQYSRKLNDVGSFSLTVLAQDRLYNSGSLNTPILNTANLIMDIYRRPEINNPFVYEDSYLVKQVQLVGDNNTDYLVLSGVHVLDFFRWTLILPEDDPTSANGYSTKSGIADSVMISLVSNQVISPAVNLDRARPYIQNAPVFNVGLPVFIREQQVILLDVLQAISVQGRVDFTLTRTTGANWTFYPHIVGGDFTKTSNYPFGPVKTFSVLRKNIKNPTLMINRHPEATVIYVATQGIEQDRLIDSRTSGNENLPLNWREVLVDARNIEDNSSLPTAITTAAQAEIRDRQPVIEMTFDIDTNAPGGRYGLDWFLGDKVTAEYLGFTQDLRIVEVDITAEKLDEQIRPVLQLWLQ